MSWFRVDDTLHAHRKLAKAGAEAMGLWVACGSFAASAASRQDGSLDHDEVAMRALLLGVRDWKRLADKLVSVGLWEEDGDLYRFHDWDHFASADGVTEAKRLKAAERQAKSREKKRLSDAVTRDSHTSSHVTERDASHAVTSDSHTPSHDVTTPPRTPVHDRACALPVPSRPIPALPSDAGEPAGSGGDLLDMSSLRRLWNDNRERVTGSMLPAIHDADANAVLATLPKVRSVAPRPKASFADWLAVEFDAWHDVVTKEHGANATRITRAWSPVSFAGWYERNPPPAEAAPSRPVQAPQAPEGPPAAKEPAMAPLSAEERAAKAAALLGKMDAAREASQRPRFQA